MSKPKHFGTPGEPTLEELAQTKADMMLVFRMLTASSVAELDAVIADGIARGAHWGRTTARIAQEMRQKLGGATRPS